MHVDVSICMYTFIYIRILRHGEKGELKGLHGFRYA